MESSVQRGSGATLPLGISAACAARAFSTISSLDNSERTTARLAQEKISTAHFNTHSVHAIIAFDTMFMRIMTW